MADTGAVHDPARRRPPRWFWALALTILLTDCTTKQVASDRLVPHVPQPVVDDVVRFTLTHNDGAAMGLNLGDYSRVGFSLLAVVLIVVLTRAYLANRDDPRVALPLGMIVGGAAGNLLDRIRSPLGVVDFIDIGFGAHRFYIFNVADIGVTVGAGLLAFHLWKTGAEQPPSD